MKDIKIIIATHKQYFMPSDEMYLPLHVGKLGKQDLGYQGDETGENISAKNPSFCELTGTINKGQGSKYQVSSFSFVKEPLKNIVRAYEIQLAEIRETCSVIQRVRRQLVPAVKKAGVVDGSISAFITHDYPATSD